MDQSTDPGGVLGPYAAALRAALLQPFLRLNFVTLWVRDQERSRRFFMERLMFEAFFDVPTPGGGRSMLFAPDAAVGLPATTATALSGGAPVVHAQAAPH